ncbi:MAG: helix-turn-helix transcriptional regulator [Ferruginibacter sp.]
MSELSPLSKKELKILSSLSMGLLYKEIASDHGISINTVKKHVKSIYRKLEVGKRQDAIGKFFGNDHQLQPAVEMAAKENFQRY